MNMFDEIESAVRNSANSICGAFDKEQYSVRMIMEDRDWQAPKLDTLIFEVVIKFCIRKNDEPELTATLNTKFRLKLLTLDYQDVLNDELIYYGDRTTNQLYMLMKRIWG